MDPRIRERRTAVVRAASRRRRRILLAAVILVALVVGGWFLLHTKILAARVVIVVGSTHVPDARIVDAAGLAAQPPMVDVDTGAAAARLEQLPWVATATVSRQWPDGVRIAVTERTPVAAVSTTAQSTTAGQTSTGQSSTGQSPAGTTTPTTTPTTPPVASWALVDRTGRVLADGASPPAGLVHLAGPASPGPPGSVLRSAGPGLVVAASLPKAFAGQVTEVDVGSDGQVTLKLTSPVTVNLGTTAQLQDKYEDVAAILAGASLVDGDVIDVSVPESPLVTAG
ncbi:MAG TPA: FtsQ-type POTRA domain-containing protein [Acidimicrobiales bacterium]|jgi:cell division protein FtsQ|nr:FtsQ-type POTRA domain-containing protein [Acidimicrobiales bacterium]